MAVNKLSAHMSHIFFPNKGKQLNTVTEVHMQDIIGDWLNSLVTPPVARIAEPTCFGQICPSSTESCKEARKSSQDRSRIEIKISCLDYSDASIKDYYFEEASNLDPYTSYNKVRYESVNEGVSRGANPQRGRLDLTPRHYQPEYF